MLRASKYAIVAALLALPSCDIVGPERHGQVVVEDGLVEGTGTITRYQGVGHRYLHGDNDVMYQVSAESDSSAMAAYIQMIERPAGLRVEFRGRISAHSLSTIHGHMTFLDLFYIRLE